MAENKSLLFHQRGEPNDATDKKVGHSANENDSEIEQNAAVFCFVIEVTGR
jgi:hypothetical protein